MRLYRLRQRKVGETLNYSDGSAEFRIFGAGFYPMTLYEFNRLSEDKQLERVWNQATFLVRRKIGRSYLLLYALDSFYVEIRYSQDRNEVTACRPFRSPIPLEPYLLDIQINAIYSV